MSANAGRVFQEQFTAEKVYGNMMAYLEEIVLKFPKQKEVL
jgi:hypothetical protein